MKHSMKQSLHRRNARYFHNYIIDSNNTLKATSIGPQREFWFGKKEKVNLDVAKKLSEIDGSDQEHAIAKVGIGDDAPRPPKLIGLPVAHKPLFPRFFQMVQVNSPEVIQALITAKESGNGFVGVFLRKNPVSSEGDPPEIISSLEDIYKVGTFAQIHSIIPTPLGIQATIMSHRRVSIQKLEELGPPPYVGVDHWEPQEYDPESSTIKAYSNEIVATIRDLIKMNPLLSQNAHYLLSQQFEIQDPFRLSDFAASLSTAKGDVLQKILEEEIAEERLKKALDVVTKEREVAKLQEQITQQVEEKMSEQQRKYLLMEQLKSIKKELGMEKDDKAAMLEKFNKRLSEFEEDAIPQEARKTIDEELEKLSALEKNSPEFNVARNYLDWLTLLPWGKFSEENFDIAQAKTILDEDHYGLDDVKQRILEFIAIGKLKGSVHGKILCLVGPPGVGKTSIGRSIARALNREFYRFSVGGLSDVAEIKGHRRTYIGAMPGKVIQCLKSTQTSNPLILIDEIDKLGHGHQGDPASALLELLDPNQNGGFTDHYLDVPVDLSKALFLCTANVMDTIPGPLSDRMEIIRLSGYDLPDKLQIAQTYLIPKSKKETGLNEEEIKGLPPNIGIDEKAIISLIRWYCREAGVRNLEKQIHKICRKLAFHAVKYQEDGSYTPDGGWVVNEPNLHHYVGKPIFTSDRLYDSDLPPGVVMGLAWTSMGGSSLYIETTGVRGPDGKGGMLQKTGQLKSVMQESSQIAHTFARKFLQDYEGSNKYFEEYNIHLHVPEGATPKDGPSAGVTMVTALLSLALGRPVRPDVAMTGEVSLTGKVLPVGGIKEKTIAARRSGVTCLVFPEGNRRDFEELPDYLKKGLEIHFANVYKDVFDVAFCEDNLCD